MIDRAKLYDHAPCGLAVIDRQGAILDANETFLNWLGWDSLSGAPAFHELLQVGDRIYWETHLGPLLDMQGEVNEIAVAINTRHGRRSALLNAKNRRRGDPGAHIDVALFPAEDRRSYEQELLAARKAADASEEQARVLADTLMRSFIPPSLPWVPGLDLGGIYRPAGTGAEIGGDFYDAFQLSGDSWLVAVGDVCGKGAEAAAMTTATRYALRGAAMETDDLTGVLEAVNATLMLDPSDRTCTAVLGRFTGTDATEIDVTVSTAGHPLPRILRSSGAVETAGSPGTLLGALDSVSHSTESVTLRLGDSVVFYTDGVTEARHAGEFYGEERLDRTLSDLAGLPATEIAMSVAEEVIDFQEGSPRDDVALVVIRKVEVQVDESDL